jgi:hypothetical protein
MPMSALLNSHAPMLQSRTAASSSKGCEFKFSHHRCYCGRAKRFCVHCHFLPHHLKQKGSYLGHHDRNRNDPICVELPNVTKASITTTLLSSHIQETWAWGLLRDGFQFKKCPSLKITSVSDSCKYLLYYFRLFKQHNMFFLSKISPLQKEHQVLDTNAGKQPS